MLNIIRRAVRLKKYIVKPLRNNVTIFKKGLY